MPVASCSTKLTRVLEIPEILELIFSFLDEDSNARTATVCKKWSEISLNILWREVTEPIHLFTLLAPLERTYQTRSTGPMFWQDQWIFSKTPGVDDWARFMRYARRVRILYLDERGKEDVIAQGVFDEMSRSRVDLSVLPNLRVLTWLTDSVDRMRLSLLFQHKSIIHFNVYLHKTEAYPLATFFKEVLLRMPNLHYLDLRFEFPARDVEDELIELLGGLKALERVVLPVYTLTSRIMEELAKHEYLNTIQFEFMESQGRGDMDDVQNWRPQLTEGAFPALWDLSLSANLSDMTRFLTGDFAPSKLTSLYVQILSAPPGEMVSEFLNALSVHCKLLSHLYLDFFTSSAILPTPDTWSRLNYEALRPLLSCSKLVSFEMRWDHVLDITQEDVEEMASKWPSLQTLLLNCEPVDSSIPPQLDLRALLPFARHCPQLTELGLYLSATDTVDVPILDHQLKPFTSLERLCVGLSSITDAGHTALFLSQILPLGCDILAGVTWPDDVGVVETTANAVTLDRLQKEAAGWHEKWVEVSKMLPLLTKLRMDERAARESLQEEVEDLRIRCKILSERANVRMDPDGGCVPF
ncbi:hypothetical protein BDW22DRAFT_1337381 [Trametopsis cervina]|nr:hypothetical protein BDW22DRAFT_1337381 [Trametopsis cervina]